VILAAALAAVALLAPAPRLVAAGDVASCRSDGDEQTAALVERLPGTVAVLGDAVYEDGSDEEFASCYAPSWGRFLARTRPAPGNHEYRTPAAAGYFRYFGAAAGPPARGYYAYRLGGWRVVVLNTNCGPAGGCGVGSPQERWLRATLAASRARCTLAYGHHPRLSSGVHGPDRTIQPLWRALQDAGVELYLAGHDHHYERFAPARGLRQFVVGTGGRSLYPVVRKAAGSQVRWAGGYGVLSLTLRPQGYDWSFLAAGNGSFLDTGTAACR
jgi:3',5'-cyclic AMP phosphodiesterase CpdA